MRISVSMVALIGACLLAVPAQAQRVMNPTFENPDQPKRQGGQQGGGQRPAGAAQPFTAGPRQGQPQGQRQSQPQGQQFNRGGGQRHGGGGYRDDRHRGRGDDGAGIAAGAIGGLLLGAIIANESQRNECWRRPGYDRRSHTFVAPDRRRYRCP